MSYKIEEIEGIGPAFAQKLARADITTTDGLLERCGHPQGRKQVELKTGIKASQLLKWANMADLMRLKGVGPQFAELLEAAGVDTVKELKTRNALNLAKKMKQANDVKKLTRTVPGEPTLQTWINLAGEIGPSITY